ncbi:aminotransferase class I/II-fold pyridoxal phosphate-dependent enzyme [Actinomycetospora cinnamomea]|nr:aminotransferase class I/II-fold pyridoxal phosphate-dependent enzyme [Actinomycetospora cinnamomea]
MHRIGYRVVICQAPVLRSVFDLIRSSYLRPILASVDEASTLLHAHPKSTAVVYLCSPQNPTGAVLHVDDVGSLIADVQRTASAVVIDSVYDSYCFTRSLDVRDYGRLPPASVTFVNSMSKNYGAPGIRIGWLVGNSDLIGQLIVRQEYESIAVNGLGQAAAIDLLDAGNSELIARVADGRSQVQDWWLARGNYPELRIDGGTQAALPVLASTDPEKLADDLMLRHDVVVSSSANYRGVSYPFLRLPLGVPRARLDTILSAYDQVHQE